MKYTPTKIQALTACAGLLGSLVASGAHAQAAPPSSVTLYGLIDAGVEYVNKVDGKGSLQRMPSNTGSLPSRVGFRGSEDLGNGLRAVFTAEMGFAPDQGTAGQGGRLFGRQAFVGLAGPWGAVTAGRQYSMLFWSMLDADIIGPAVHGIGSLDSYIPNARADNALAYRGTFGALQLGAQYSLGRDAVNAGPSPVPFPFPRHIPQETHHAYATSPFHPGAGQRGRPGLIRPAVGFCPDPAAGPGQDHVRLPAWLCG